MSTHLQLAAWRCHKIVRAAKIVGVEPGRDAVLLTLSPEHVISDTPTTLTVPPNWPPFLNSPQLVGGFYVLYADGYESWSPAAAFKDGYTLLPQPPAEPVNLCAHHPAIAHVLAYFKFEHLPPKLQEVSKPFSVLAHQCADRAPQSQETTVALRKLLEAKDAAVRAAL